MFHLVACSALLFTLSAVNAAAITNGQLFEMFQEYRQDVKDIEDDGMSVQDDAIIHLTGDEDDEVDVESLMAKLGLLSGEEGQVTARDDPLVGGGCSCHKDTCTCCVGKVFTLHLLSKKVSAVIHACVTVEYVPSDTDFKLRYVLNGQTVYDKVVSLTHPPKICARMKGALTTALVCLDIYNVNIGKKSLCTRLLGVLDFKIKKVYFRLGLACFKIPALSYDWLAEMRSRKQKLISAERVTSANDTMMTSY